MRLAVLCPGQGHQHPGMLELVASNADARAVFDEAAEALGTHPLDWLHDAATMVRNRIAQPLICIAQLAAWRAIAARMPRPGAFAGYSVGELAAYGCAGALGAHDLARLARARARAMDHACHGRPGKMAALRGLSRRELEALCNEEGAWPAIVVDDAAVVVGGSADAIDRLMAIARSQGAHVQRLPVEIAAHTPLLAEAVAPFRAALEASPLRDAQIPVLAGIDGSLVTRRADAIDSLSRQVAQTIDWSRVLLTLEERGCRIFLELGPGAALSRMIRDRFRDVDARSLDDFRSLDGALAWVAARAG